MQQATNLNNKRRKMEPTCIDFSKIYMFKEHASGIPSLFKGIPLCPINIGKAHYVDVSFYSAEMERQWIIFTRPFEHKNVSVDLLTEYVPKEEITLEIEI